MKLKLLLPVSLLLAVAVFLVSAIQLPRIRQQEEKLSLIQEPQVLAQEDSQRQLTILIDEQPVSMSMEEYLRGVLRAEMPASFSMEALKAQAVAARSYTLYRMAHGPIANHPEADACDDIHCCKAFRAAGEMESFWGNSFVDYEKKIRQAVAETDGIVASYEGTPILAVFHSFNSGKTQNSQDVWLSSIPYLVSVDSPETADTVPNFHSEVRFSAQEFRDLFSASYPQAQWEGNLSHWFSGLTRNDAGMVTALTVGGITLTGVELRSLLQLRSACFELETTEQTVTFHVTGYGHGVGMSQYGANLLAQQGLSYQEIITWYYPGVTIS